MNKDFACYFRSSWRDMGAIIPCCTYGDINDPKSWSITEKDCQKCSHFLSAKDVPNFSKVLRLAIDEKSAMHELYDAWCEIGQQLEKIKKGRSSQI